MEDQPERNRDINYTDDTATTRTQSQTAAIDEIESEHEQTVDNDHTLDDVRTQNQLSTTSAALAKEKTKRRSKPLLVFLLALSMALLGAAAGIVLYKAYFEKQPTQSTATSTTTTTSTSSTRKQNAEQIVAAIKAKMKSSEVQTSVPTGMQMATTRDGMGAYSVPYASPTGYDFYTVPATMSGFTVASSNTETIFSDAMTARNYLGENGFTSSSVTMDNENNIIMRSDFTSTDVRCTVEETTYSYGGGNQVQVGCADNAQYAKNAESLKPLYLVYAAAKPTVKTPGLMLGKADIKASSVSGYNHADLSTGDMFSPVGGSVALLYQTPDKSWHYFTNTQSTLLCSAYNTPELKKAFAGSPCGTEDGKESKVTP